MIDGACWCQLLARPSSILRGKRFARIPHHRRLLLDEALEPRESTLNLLVLPARPAQPKDGLGCETLNEGAAEGAGNEEIGLAEASARYVERHRREAAGAETHGKQRAKGGLRPAADAPTCRQCSRTCRLLTAWVLVAARPDARRSRHAPFCTLPPSGHGWSTAGQVKRRARGAHPPVEWNAATKAARV